MLWGPRRLVGFREVSVIPAKILVPESPTEFVTYDVTTATALRISFKVDNNRILSLAIRTDKGEVIAVRR
jgi:hypothetical protein